MAQERGLEMVAHSAIIGVVLYFIMTVRLGNQLELVRVLVKLLAHLKQILLQRVALVLLTLQVLAFRLRQLWQPVKF